MLWYLLKSNKGCNLGYITGSMASRWEWLIAQIYANQTVSIVLCTYFVPGTKPQVLGYKAERHGLLTAERNKW